MFSNLELDYDDSPKVDYLQHRIGRWQVLAHMKNERSKRDDF